jgi:RNA polymerase sigma-70 factor (ECF subfamily)
MTQALDSRTTIDTAHPPLDSTAVLLGRIHAGDVTARDRLLSRYAPVLRRWAHGRLPASARGMADTDDLVQVSLVGAWNRLGMFEHLGRGSFLAYLRRCVLNAIRQEIRRSRRRPAGVEMACEPADGVRSVVEEAIGRETLERYEAALLELGEERREAAMLRLEFGWSYQEIADALGKKNANVARMLVVRALAVLAERMRD